MVDDYVLITGASSGLGQAFAEVFARNKHNVILLARRKDKLREIANHLSNAYEIKAAFYACDLLDRKAIDRCMEQILEDGYCIKMLVNNAGMSNFGEFSQTSFDDEDQIMQLNMVALVYLTKKLLPRLLEIGEAKILNVSSLVGHYPLPYQAVYAASKAFVLSFSQALHSELNGAGVQVSVMCPGNIRTQFISNSGLQKLYSKMSIKDMEPEVVARITYSEFMKGKRSIYPGRSLNWIMRLMLLLFPDALTDSQYQRRKSILDG
jgi:short-subunit dehydrogenase